MYLGPVAAPPVFVPVGPEVGTVAYEARRLDRLFPGWYEGIDVDELRMMDGHKCVLGQGVCNYDFEAGPFLDYGRASDVVERDAGRLGQRRADVLVNYLMQYTVPEWTREIERRRSW